ncbi:Mitochondrial substrate carrier family protein, partial [Prunus dulcis]
ADSTARDVIGGELVRKFLGFLSRHFSRIGAQTLSSTLIPFEHNPTNLSLVMFYEGLTYLTELYDISCNSLGCDQNKNANTGVKGARAAWMQFVAYKWLKMHRGCLEVAVSGSPNVTSNEGLGNVATKKLLACSRGIGITFTKERVRNLH